jgi:hypothetical protein
MSVEKYISPFIQTHFPEFYKEYGPNFIAFTKAYYEWLESAGNPLNLSRNLYEYGNIDTTLEQFIIYFKNKYMSALPTSTSSDQRFLVKHITDLYRSKGTPRAYELLFRILFNEDLEIYIPGNDLFRLSNNKYVKPHYIEVSDSIYLGNLLGKYIKSSDGLGEAVVENYYTKNVNNKILNVLVLSSITGVFKYNQRVICDDLYVDSSGNTISAYEYNQLSTISQTAYSLALTVTNGPFILGSLSAIGITNGGAGFSLGDLLSLNADGSAGVARVTGVKNENGKVNFTLVNGGSGFSVNAAVTVTGGSGAGATFKIGGLIDTEVLVINTDKIQDSYNTQLDGSADGANLNITGVTGTFYVGDNIHSIAQVNVITMDISYIGAVGLANGEALYSNTKNINMANTTVPGANLTVYRVDQSLIYAVGSQITNANLIIGTILTSNTSNTKILVNSVFPQNTYGNGTVTFVNSSVISVNGAFGSFVPGYRITSSNTSANATVTAMTRNTDWSQFPKPTLTRKNLDQQIGQILTTYDLEVGTIAYLSQINPGDGYSSDPVVDVTETAVYDLKILDGSGYKGHNAIVTAKAGNANGIVTAVEIENSGFGYTPISQANLYSSNTQNENIVSGRIVIDTQGVGSGNFANRSGFLSDTQHVIDSYYWQSQSYDLVASRMISTYEKFVRDLVHPAGIALFGTYRILSETDNEVSEPISFSLVSS